MPDRKMLPLADLLDRLAAEERPALGAPPDEAGAQQPKPLPGTEPSD
jgi:hypothetical protein